MTRTEVTTRGITLAGVLLTTVTTFGCQVPGRDDARNDAPTIDAQTIDAATPEATAQEQPIPSSQDLAEATAGPSRSAHFSGGSVERDESDARMSHSVETIALGFSVDGRPLEAFAMGDPALPSALFIATIHGNEGAGTPLLEELQRYLTTHVDGLYTHRAIVIPVANPDGYANRTRHNTNGVDLNRNFPAANFRTTRRHGPEPLSEPEARAIHVALERFKPQRVVSIHQPYGVIDFDGPGEELAYAMSLRSPLPVKRVGSRAGSLGSYVGETLGVPIITLELPGADKRLSGTELWERYGDMLIAVVRDLP